MSMSFRPISQQSPAIGARPSPNEEANESAADGGQEAAKAAPAPGKGTLVDINA
jgi:hypothetical protein